MLWFTNCTRVLWGAVMTFMGLVTNWSGLMAARWFLGLAEAGLFPGINYYLSCWYKRDEFGIRAVSQHQMFQNLQPKSYSFLSTIFKSNF
jgi:MFS family permease